MFAFELTKLMTSRP